MADTRWTDEQVAAITAPSDLLLTASAGTGKTTTIVGKVLWQLGLDIGPAASGRPVPPCPEPCALDEIAAITFTEKAAYDLKGKLRRDIERSTRGAELRWHLDRASVGTIHGFCAELLRDHALRLGIDPTFRVLDERESQLQQDEIIRDALLEALTAGDEGARLLVNRFQMKRIQHRDGAIGRIRKVMRDVRWRARRYDRWLAGERLDASRVRGAAESAGIWSEQPEEAERDEDSLRLAAALFAFARTVAGRWLSWLESENARDFDSLVLDARRLLTRPETRPALESIRSRYRILIIDEFQDTDDAQRDIAFAIAGLGERGGETPPRPGGPQLFLVGDPKQSIYRFRGADVSVWNAVAETIAGRGQLLRLSHNFRSEPAVVDFVNRVCGRALGERAEEIAAESPASRVDYAALEPAREPSAAAGLDWLAVDAGGSASDRAEAEARLVASRISQLVGRATVIDPETSAPRPCRFRDIAIIARTRRNLAAVEPGLRQFGIPYYNAATSGLSDRPEVLDLVSVLRLLQNPHADAHAFAFLRSPFVGLRDEVLARLRLDEATGRTSLLRQARRFLDAAESGELTWFPAAESPRVADVERQALRRGLEVIEESRPLVDRVDTAEILETVLRRTGYRLHLLLRDAAAEALANLERFLALVEDYRHLPLGGFLALWDRWGSEELGIPQAPLFSKEDDVVTLTTIHTAKGLEWPVVVLIATQEGKATAGHLTGTYWSDPSFGPVFMPKQEERGPRGSRLLERELREDAAEEARLLYVATTRARDRLVLSGLTERPAGYAEWLGIGLEDALEEHEARDLLDGPANGEGRDGVDAREGAADPAASSSSGARRRSAGATSDDQATGTGRQLDVFGFDDAAEEESGQFSLFGSGAAAMEPEPGATGASARSVSSRRRLVIYRKPIAIQASLRPPPLSLAWLERIEPAEALPLVRPIRVSALRFTSSATEAMVRARRPEEWELRYRHGVQPVWRFAPDPARDGKLSPTVRGILIHGVLERIEEEEEIARVLGETIAGIDTPELEELLAPGTSYREALEEEIERVVQSSEWSWYTEGAPARELRFVHFAASGDWRQGAFDLYRPAAASAAGAPRDRWTWIVDFKTHQIDQGAVSTTAREYRIQAAVYREAAGALAASPEVRVLFHFTHPNLAVEVGAPSPAVAPAG